MIKPEGDEDMALPRDTAAAYVGLSQRVSSLDDDFRELKGIVTDLGRSISVRDAALHTKIDTFSTATNTQINTFASAINAKIDQSRSPQWQMYSVFLVAIITIGTLAYWPIRDKQMDLHDTLTSDRAALSAAIADTNKSLTAFMLVTPERFEPAVNAQRTRDRLDREIEKMRDGIVTRAEHQGHWDAIQRQIDDLKRK